MRDSLFFRTISKIIFPSYLVVSILLYWRGHNAPGGGFVAGLLAGIAFTVIGLASGRKAMTQSYGLRSFTLVRSGLGIALLSGFISILFQQRGQLFQGYWIHLFNGSLSLGTPMLFDLGVFLVVLGIVVNFTSHFLEESDKD